MDQPTFADLEYQGKKRKTRRELFLERMDGLIPWQSLEDRIRPFYSTADCRTREYMCRRTGEGMSKAEVIRCLKRYVAREVFPVIKNSSAMADSVA